MVNLLTDILGMTVKYSKWEGAENLPLYMIGGSDYKKAIIDEVPCIIMTLNFEIPTLPALKKQIKRIQNIDSLPVVIKVSSMSAFRIKNMIEAHIPFIIAEEQAYLPFMGTFLKAKYVNHESDDKKLERFRFSTQQLCLWYLYQQNQKAYISDAAKICSFSSMTMTRATRELVATGMLIVEKDGVKKFVNCEYSKQALFDGIKQYMKSPVVAEGYLDLQSVNANMIPAGITALAERSMLNGDKLKTFAVREGKFDKSKLMDELVDPDKQVKIELWSYDPFLFTSDGMADPISVVLSLIENQDERVEITIEEMLEKLWEEIEW